MLFYIHPHADQPNSESVNFGLFALTSVELNSTQYTLGLYYDTNTFCTNKNLAYIKNLFTLISSQHQH